MPARCALPMPSLPSRWITEIRGCWRASRSSVAPVPSGEPSSMKRRSEEHTSELQSRLHLVCRLLLEKKKKKRQREDTLEIKKYNIVNDKIRAVSVRWQQT